MALSCRRKEVQGGIRGQLILIPVDEQLNVKRHSPWRRSVFFYVLTSYLRIVHYIVFLVRVLARTKCLPACTLSGQQYVTRQVNMKDSVANSRLQIVTITRLNRPGCCSTESGLGANNMERYYYFCHPLLIDLTTHLFFAPAANLCIELWFLSPFHTHGLP